MELIFLVEDGDVEYYSVKSNSDKFVNLRALVARVKGLLQLTIMIFLSVLGLNHFS